MSKHHRKYDKTADEIAEIAGGLQNGENAMKETEVFAEEFTEGFDLEAVEEADEVTEAVDEIEEAVEAVDEIEEAVEAVDEIEEATEAEEEEAEEAAEAEEEVEDATEAEEEAEEVTEAEEAAEEVTEAEEEAEEAAEAEEEVEEATEAEEAEEAAEAEEEVEEATEAEEAEEVTAAEEAAEEATEAEEEAEEVTEVEEAAEEATEAEEEAEEVTEAEEAAEEVTEAEEAEEVTEVEEAAEEVTEAEEAEEVTEAEEEAEEAEEVTEAEEAEEVTEAEEAEEVTEAEEEADEADEVEEEAEEADEAEEEAEEVTEAEEEVDEDDYLDYDEDEPREKKIVSGKTAVFTMLLTGLCTIALIAGAFILATTVKKDMGLSLVSYTDKFNACDTNEFSYAPMLGLENVSYSDAEMTLTPADVKALSSGKTVTKFDGLVNIQAKVRFGKLVSMDINFDPAINESQGASAFYMMLVGNVLSGLYPEPVVNSDESFMLAYTVISYAMPAPSAPENVYRYLFGDIAIYMDHNKVMESGNVSDLSYHIENKDPHYLDTSKIDLSWLPWNKAEAEQTEDDAVWVSDGDASAEVSGSDATE